MSSDSEGSDDDEDSEDSSGWEDDDNSSEYEEQGEDDDGEEMRESVHCEHDEPDGNDDDTRMQKKQRLVQIPLRRKET